MDLAINTQSRCTAFFALDVHPVAHELIIRGTRSLGKREISGEPSSDRPE